MPSPDTIERTDPAAALDAELNVPYVLIVWDDPVNLMSYVSYVFQSYFGYSRARADQLMMQVHQQGRAIVATGALEKIEADVAAMHGYGLQATFKRADQA
ncbi:ATP-dependent Clp protease adapter ClpS [Zhihengliuella flava]|uniref:ATP-dependent Clp protease adapter protein ClpS n=1 Tax=Zhihengliuella flava TaxID=1285193 RepID=A0A931DB32_9MICC|nr:ATP-dependent Clp protease adapter ClpS [Zhihengliuella flava]MBG6083618.1 ATP-dependent Clp protease adaptor protein ClpS [Zhihengliuella flava]